MEQYRSQIDDNTIVTIKNNYVNLSKLVNGKIYDFNFIKTDDYLFSTFCENDNNEVNFEIDLNNPLYVPFRILLKDDDIIIINSDLSRKENDNQKFI